MNNYAKWGKLIGVITPGGDPAYECSNCHSTFIFGIEQEIKQPPEECPNCHYKMMKSISQIRI